MMRRDSANSQQRPSKSAPNNYNQPQQQSFNNTNNHQFHHANNHHKIVHFEPFCLISQDDKSLKQAAELVESASLSRFKVCVVTIISKEALDGTVKNSLAQAALNNNNGSRRRQNNNRFQQQRGQTVSTKASQSNETHEQTKNLVDDLLLLNSHENQVLGQVDSKADVIVLNLTSFLEADKVCLLSETIDELFEPNPTQLEERLRQSFVSKSWPKWNQNLVKTLLILFLMSHIIVFYHPEPSIDYNLIHLFKILETLRLKSQNRITDLLETIASNQMFPQQWIRQGRLSCPRALFVCDCSNLDFKFNQSDVAATKRDLEDQIYILLKKTNITCRPLVSANQQIQQALLCLPERDDFVFIMTKQDLPFAPKQKRSYDPNSSAKLRAQRRNQHTDAKEDYNDFYSKLFESLQISCQTNKAATNNGRASAKKQSLSSNADENHDSQDEANANNQACEGTEDGAEEEIDATATAAMPSEPSQDPNNPIRHKSTAHQNRFRKFLLRHITDIQSSLAQVGESQDNNNKHYGSKQNIVMPRYDDFFTVLLRLKNLLFPMQPQTIQQPSNEITTIEIQASSSSTSAHQQEPEHNNIWLVPDERRFVDIYDLFSNDELFSKHHCHKARSAAFEYFGRLILAPQTKNPSVPWPPAKEFYLKHARGPACTSNLRLLEEQCSKYWQNVSSSDLACNPNESAHCGGGRYAKFPGNRLSRAKSSDLPNGCFAPPSNLLQPNNGLNNQQQHQHQTLTKQSSLLITRRNNGIKMMASCDCGRQSNFIITPVDRKKKLERVDIHRLND